MPIYEYQCPHCEAVFEEWVHVSDATDTAVCPQCGGNAVHIISNTAFVLKGGGWYATDYGNRKNEGKETSGGEAPVAKAESAPAAAAAKAEPAASTPESAPAASSTSSAAAPSA